MPRLTERDEYGNADIIALSDIMPEIYAELSFSETNALTDALNKLADLEDKDEPKKVLMVGYRYPKLHESEQPPLILKPYCPACNIRLFNKKAEYCESCGQHLDWSV